MDANEDDDEDARRIPGTTAAAMPLALPWRQHPRGGLEESQQCRILLFENCLRAWENPQSREFESNDTYPLGESFFQFTEFIRHHVFCLSDEEVTTKAASTLPRLDYSKTGLIYKECRRRSDSTQSPD